MDYWKSSLCQDDSSVWAKLNISEQKVRLVFGIGEIRCFGEYNMCKVSQH